MTSGPDWVRHYFAKAAPHLQAALDAEPIRTHTLVHVREAIESNEAQLWPMSDAAVVTEIKVYPTGARVLSYWLAGGALESIVRLHQFAIEPFAIDKRCVGIEVRGRRGWARTLREQGFEPPVGTYFVKRL
jgi:hypothetical protein